jgi:hypothetical protein
MPFRARAALLSLPLTWFALAAPGAQSAITTPKAHLGFSFGDDYQLANYSQIADYWRRLDA